MENYFISLMQKNSGELLKFIDEIKTSVQADLFEDEIFDNYDWKSFALDTEHYTIDICDKLAAKMRILCHSDMGAWTLSFNTLLLPVSKKLLQLQALAQKIVSILSETGMLNTRLYDDYVSAVNFMHAHRNEIITELTLYIDYIENKFSQPSLVKQMRENIRSLQEQFESTPKIKSADDFKKLSDLAEEENYDVANRFIDSEIDADAAYNESLRLLDEGRTKQAITLLERIAGYRNAIELIEKYSSIYNFHNALEIGGKTYLRRKNERDSYDIYDIDENAVASSTPLITNMQTIIGSYAEFIYYVDNTGTIKCYNLGAKSFETILMDTLSDNVGKELSSLRIEKKLLAVNNSILYILGTDSRLIQLNLKDVRASLISKDVQELYFANEKYVIYKASQINSYKVKKKVVTNTTTSVLAYDLEAKTNVSIPLEPDNKILDLIGDTLIYADTIGDNFTLSSIRISFDSVKFTLEENVYSYLPLSLIKDSNPDALIKFDGTIFYKVGRKDLNSIVSLDISPILNADETIIGNSRMNHYELYNEEEVYDDYGQMTRREIAKYSLQTKAWGDDIYYITDFPSNACLVHSSFSNPAKEIIAHNVYKIAGVCCNYVYFIDLNSELYRINKDGSNKKLIFSNIHEVLNISNGKIYFDATDDENFNIDTVTEEEISEIAEIEEPSPEIEEFKEEPIIPIEPTEIVLEESPSEIETPSNDNPKKKTKKVKVKKPKIKKEKKEKKPKKSKTPKKSKKAAIVEEVKNDQIDVLQDFMIKSANIKGSFYCMDLNGDNLKKIAYDIFDAGVYKKQSYIDYLVKEKDGSKLYRYDTVTNEKQLILNLSPIKEETKPKKKGCYVATCIYGSYDCDEVRVLRRFRDTTLSSNIFGRTFIKIYYAFAPTAVKLFGNTHWFNLFFKKRLDKLVSKQVKKGLNGSKYTDQ